MYGILHISKEVSLHGIFAKLNMPQAIADYQYPLVLMLTLTRMLLCLQPCTNAHPELPMGIFSEITVYLPRCVSLVSVEVEVPVETVCFDCFLLSCSSSFINTSLPVSPLVSHTRGGWGTFLPCPLLSTMGDSPRTAPGCVPLSTSSSILSSLDSWIVSSLPRDKTAVCRRESTSLEVDG